MGILIPFMFFGISYKNILDLFNKIRRNILDLEEQLKLEKEKYEKDINKLKEKNKKIEEDLKKYQISNQNLLKIKEQLENLNMNFEQQIKTEKELNIQKDQKIINLKNDINNVNKNFETINELSKKNFEKYNNLINEKESNIKLISKKNEEYQKNINEKESKIKHLSQIIETYKEQFNDFEIKMKKLKEEKVQYYSNLEKENQILKNRIKEQSIINKKNDELIRSYEIKISELKLENEKNNVNKLFKNSSKNIDKELEIIKEKYEVMVKEDIIKIRKKLFKLIGDNLAKIKLKYEEVINKKDIALNAKIEEMKKLIYKTNGNQENQNIMNFSAVKDIETRNSDYNLELDDINNLSKTELNLKTYKNNITNVNDNFNKNKNSTKEIINKNILNFTPQEIPHNPIDGKNEKKSRIDYFGITPKGEEETINNPNQHISDYSFDCTNSMYLTSYIFKGTNEVRQEIILKNNGKKQWPENSSLKYLDKSDFITTDILLNPQKPGEEKSYFLNLNNLNTFPQGEYKVTFAFVANGKICGDELLIRIKILDKDNQQDEIIEFLDNINEFRDTFSLSEDDYPNERILEILKENNFNYEKSFSTLFG